MAAAQTAARGATGGATPPHRAQRLQSSGETCGRPVGRASSAEITTLAVEQAVGASEPIAMRAAAGAKA